MGWKWIDQQITLLSIQYNKITKLTICYLHMSRIDGRKKKRKNRYLVFYMYVVAKLLNSISNMARITLPSLNAYYILWLSNGNISWNFLLELNWNYLKRIFLHSLFKGYTLWKVYQFSFSFSFLIGKKYVNFHYSSICIIITLCSNSLNLLPISITYQNIKGMSYSSNSFITLVLNTSIHIFISYSY